MTKEEILARNDCFNCGAEATYTDKSDTDLVSDDSVLVDCCNIDCSVGRKGPLWATVGQIAFHARLIGGAKL